MSQDLNTTESFDCIYCSSDNFSMLYANRNKLATNNEFNFKVSTYALVIGWFNAQKLLISIVAIQDNLRAIKKRIGTLMTFLTPEQLKENMKE